MGRKLRRLADDTAIDVADHPSLSANHAGDFFEDANRIGTLPSLVGVRKVLTDVTETGSAKKCIGTRVGNDIGVTVTNKTLRTLEHDTAENELSSRIIGEAMDVEALPDSDASDVL